MRKLLPLFLTLLVAFGCKAGKPGPPTPDATVAPSPSTSSTEHRLGSFVPPTEGLPGRSVLEFGAVADGVQVFDCGITATLTALTCNTSQPFKSTDTTKKIIVKGAGAAGADLLTTIAAYTSASAVTLTAAAGTTVTNATTTYGTDNGTPFQTAMTAMAGTNAPLTIPPGIFMVASQVTIGSKTTIVGTSSTLLVMAMTFTGTQVNVPLRAGPASSVGTGTLAATPSPAVGGLTFSVTSTGGTVPTIGLVLFVQQAAATGAAYYDIKNVTGAGPYTVTVDRPNVFPFLSGDKANVLPANGYPRDIRIFGNGMRITGTGDRSIELLAVYRSYVEDVHYETSGGTIGDAAMSMDIGCRESGFRRSSVDFTGAASTQVGIILESGERCYIAESRVKNAPSTGMAMYDCFGSFITGSHIYGGCTAGAVYLGTDGGPAFGDFDCSVVSTTAVGTTQGFTTAVGVRNYLTDVSALACGNALNVTSGSKGTIVRAFDASYSGSGSTSAIILADDVDIDGLVAKNMPSQNNNQILVAQGTGVTSLKNLDMQSAVASSIFVSLNSTGRGYVSRARFQADAASTTALFAQSSGTLQAENVVLAGSGIATMTPLFGNTGSPTIIDGPGNNWTGSAGPFLSTGTIQLTQNLGEVTDSATTTGTKALTLTQAKANTIRTSAALTGALLVTVPTGLLGAHWVFVNATSNAFAVTFGVAGGAAITVAQGKTAICRTDETGANMIRVTPDTMILDPARVLETLPHLFDDANDTAQPDERKAA